MAVTFIKWLKTFWIQSFYNFFLQSFFQTSVYIASPVSQWPTIKEISAEATKLIKNFTKSSKIFYGADLTKFLEEKYNKCGWYGKWKGEIISMVEQAICSDTWEFYGWPVSSWSSRIGKVRKLFEVGDPKKKGKRYNTISLLKESVEDGFVMPTKKTK